MGERLTADELARIRVRVESDGRMRTARLLLDEVDALTRERDRWLGVAQDYGPRLIAAEADNARLREALERIARPIVGDGEATAEENAAYHARHLRVRQQIARAALAGSPAPATEGKE